MPQAKRGREVGLGWLLPVKQPRISWVALCLFVSMGWNSLSGAADAGPPLENGTAVAVRGQTLTMRSLLEAATLSGVTIAPNGRYVCVRVERPDVTTNRVELEWYILRLPSGIVMARAGGGDADLHPSGYFAVANAQWSSDSRWLYFRKLNRGQLALWRLSIDGATKEVVAASSDIDGFLLDSRHHKILYWIGPSRNELAEAKR